MNSSLIEGKPNLPDGLDVLAIPISDIATELGSPKSINMVALGAYLQKKGILTAHAAADCLADVLAKRYHKLLSVNIEALHRGSSFAEQSNPCPLKR